MDRPRVSEAARDAYDTIADRLAADRAARGQMMGMPTLYIGGKAFAGLFGDAMVFKLDGDAHTDALGLPGAALFDPSGRGRPMKAWVQVPLQAASSWPQLADAALLTARTSPASRSSQATR